VSGSHVTWHTKSYRNLTPVGFGRSPVYQGTFIQELIRRWDSKCELLRSAPGSYLNLLK